MVFRAIVDEYLRSAILANNHALNAPAVPSRRGIRFRFITFYWTNYGIFWSPQPCPQASRLTGASAPETH